MMRNANIRRVTEAEMESGVKAKCTGCGSRSTVAAIKRRHPKALSCCPERDMRLVTS